MNQRHPFSQYSDLPRAASSANPLQHAPQSSFARQFCVRCKTIQPTKGSKKPNGMRTCAKCLPKEAT
jgi:hypothetical protein